MSKVVIMYKIIDEGNECPYRDPEDGHCRNDMDGSYCPYDSIPDDCPLEDEKEDMDG